MAPTENDSGAAEGASSEAEDRAGPSSSGGVADWMAALRDVSQYLDLGWRLAASAAGPLLLGHFLVDRWLGTTPWGVLGGAVLGVAAAVVQLRRLQEEFGG